MIELRDFFQSGLFQEAVASKQFCNRDNGCIGVSVAYEPIFILMGQQIWERPTDRDFPPFGRYSWAKSLPRLLYEATLYLGVDGERREFSDSYMVNTLANQWREYCKYMYGGEKFPLRVEATLSKEAALDYDVTPQLETDRFLWQVSLGARFKLSRRRRRRRRGQPHHVSNRVSVATSTPSVSPATVMGVLRDPTHPERSFVLTVAHAFEMEGQHSLSVPLRFSRQREGLLGWLLGPNYYARTGILHSGNISFADERIELAGTEVAPPTQGLDAALIQTDSIRIISRRASPLGKWQVSKTDIFELNGETSGSVRVRMASQSYWHEFEDPYSDCIRCLNGCILMQHAEYQYNTKAVVRGGDSGAGVFRSVNNDVQWLGMAIGGDDSRAAVVPAVDIQRWVAGRLSENFEVFV